MLAVFWNDWCILLLIYRCHRSGQGMVVEIKCGSNIRFSLPVLHTGVPLLDGIQKCLLAYKVVSSL